MLIKKYFLSLKKKKTLEDDIDFNSFDIIQLNHKLSFIRIRDHVFISTLGFFCLYFCMGFFIMPTLNEVVINNINYFYPSNDYWSLSYQFTLLNTFINPSHAFYYEESQLFIKNIITFPFAIMFFIFSRYFIDFLFLLFTDKQYDIDDFSKPFLVSSFITTFILWLFYDLFSFVLILTAINAFFFIFVFALFVSSFGDLTVHFSFIDILFSNKGKLKKEKIEKINQNKKNKEFISKIEKENTTMEEEILSTQSSISELFNNCQTESVFKKAYPDFSTSLFFKQSQSLINQFKDKVRGDEADEFQRLYEKRFKIKKINNE